MLQKNINSIDREDETKDREDETKDREIIQISKGKKKSASADFLVYYI